MKNRATPEVALAKRRQSGRPALFSKEEVIAAALNILEKNGRPSLTIRALAEHLGTGHASLYNYFDNLADLEDAVAASLLLRVPLPDARSRKQFREQLLATTVAYRDARILHAYWGQIAGPRAAEAGAQNLETYLAAADACGLDLERAAILFYALDALAVQQAMARQFGAKSNGPPPRPGPYSERMHKTPAFKGDHEQRFRSVVLRLMDSLLPELAG